MARNSHRVGVCDVDLVPSSLLQFLTRPEDWRPRMERMPTIGQFVRAGEATIVAVGSSSVTLRVVGGLQTTIVELLRADLDDDGWEDMLMAVHGRAIGGSTGTQQRLSSSLDVSPTPRFKRPKW